jgi:hypothetical protein
MLAVLREHLPASKQAAGSKHSSRDNYAKLALTLVCRQPKAAFGGCMLLQAPDRAQCIDNMLSLAELNCSPCP